MFYIFTHTTHRLGADIIAASEHVRLLGVTLSSDLSLEKHVSTVHCECNLFRSFETDTSDSEVAGREINSGHTCPRICDISC